jgi:hypothetical protein
MVVNKAESVHSVMTTLLLQLLPFRRILNYETIIMDKGVNVNGYGILVTFHYLRPHAGISRMKREIMG